MKIKENILKILGVFLIVTFSIVSILLALVERDISDSEIKSLISYSSFFENRFYDYRINQQEKFKEINPNIVLIKIDDESLQKIGTWPLPRTTWVNLINKLNKFNSKVLAFDIMFPESAPKTKESNPDEDFKNAIKEFQSSGKRRIILPYTNQDFISQYSYKEVPIELYDYMLDSRQVGKENLLPHYVSKHTFPITTLLEASPDLAYINMLEDSDGVFRHYKMVTNVDSTYFPSLGLMAYQSLNELNSEVVVNRNGSAILNFKDKELELNHSGENKIRWFGSRENFYNIPLWKVLDAKDDDTKLKALFENKLVFLGSTAVGAHDLRNTPIDSKLPGVYAHINIVHMLMNNFTYKTVQASIGITIVILVIALGLMLTIMFFSNALYDILSLILICTAIYQIDKFYFIADGYELKLAFTFFSIITSYSWITLINFHKSNKDKKQIKTAFSRYVAPSIVNDMLSNPEKLKVGGERRDITCLFSDVRDFTSISEELSATDLARCLNKYMGKMTDVVFENSGTLDKYIGDAIVAFWGAPLDLENHETHAVSAAVEMIEILPEVNKEFQSEGFPEFKIGIGLNSGECNVGNMGSDSIFAYTALGDNMNLGARLESLCKHYGAQILISGKTYERIDNKKFRCRKIDNVQVKGKEVGSLVYEVLYSYHPIYMDTYSFENFNKAYALFEDKSFTQALDSVEKVLESHPKDIPSILLKDKINAYISSAPLEGVDHTLTRMNTK